MVPQSWTPGTPLIVEAPNGRQMSVQVPTGLSGGDYFLVHFPNDAEGLIGTALELFICPSVRRCSRLLLRVCDCASTLKNKCNWQKPCGLVWKKNDSTRSSSASLRSENWFVIDVLIAGL